MQILPFTLERQFQEIGSDIEEAVIKVLKGGQYIGGQEIAEFEENFASLVGVNHAVGCNSGTDALILALRALDIGEGDEVITSSFSFFATAEAISAVGANPVLVDINPNDYLINIGSGYENTIKGYAKFIMKKLNVNLKIVYDKTKPNGTPRKKLDINLAKNYGWKSKISFSQGFDFVFNDFKKNKNLK